MIEPAKVYRPSNGSEGEWFFERFCARCRHDESNGGACDRMMRSMAYRVGDPQYPQEWRYTIGPDGLDAWCTAFAGLGSGGDDGERHAA